MSKFKVTYFAPYTFANFTCEAATPQEALAKLEQYHAANQQCIPNRDIKTMTFGGKKISTNGSFI